MACNDLLQPLALIWDSLVHSPPQLRLDFLELCLHAVTPGLPLKLEEAPARLTADEGEAQKREGVRSTDTAYLAIDRRAAAELNHTGLDRVERQRAAARERLTAHGARTTFVLADLTDPGWTSCVGGPFDLAVSAIAIHNLRDLGAIAACYRGVVQTLKPGGAFLDYDLFFDEIGGVEHHIELLREAGFARVECLWRQAPLATLKAVKSGG